MNSDSSDNSANLAFKISCLVEERGWSQDEFANRAGINRLTVRNILIQGEHQLRPATVAACARALGLTVRELRDLNLGSLLGRMRGPDAPTDRASLRRLYEQAMQPVLAAWLKANPDRARLLSSADLDELLSLQGTGGPLTEQGIEHFVALLQRKRRLKEQVDAVAGTEYLDLLEKLVTLLYEKIQPYRDRS